MTWYLLSFLALLPAPLLASVYQIDEAYENHLCLSVLAALNAGYVKDADANPCARKFALDDDANRFGFRTIERRPVSKAKYRATWDQITEATLSHGLISIPLGQYRAERKAEIDSAMKDQAIAFYLSHFDIGNTGSDVDVLLYESTDNECSPSEQGISSPAIYPLLENGSIDPLWVGGLVFGNPFQFEGSTYLATWEWDPRETDPKKLQKDRNEKLIVYSPTTRPSPRPFASAGIPQCVIHQIAEVR